MFKKRGKFETFGLRLQHILENEIMLVLLVTYLSNHDSHYEQESDFADEKHD